MYGERSECIKCVRAIVSSIWAVNFPLLSMKCSFFFAMSTAGRHLFFITYSINYSLCIFVTSNQVKMVVFFSRHIMTRIMRSDYLKWYFMLRFYLWFLLTFCYLTRIYISYLNTFFSFPINRLSFTNIVWLRRLHFNCLLRWSFCISRQFFFCHCINM